MEAKTISIIIPVLNEASLLPQTLSAVQPLRSNGHELIVVDGGSTDNSLTLSLPYSDRVIRSRQGRSCQMNTGARIAKGEIFLFLHADTLLPEGADRLILEGVKQKGKAWGRFDVRLSGRHPGLRAVECLMNLRSRITGIATGDQGIFVKREVFEAVGGFREVDLMEDITLSKVLKRHGRPLCLWQRVMTSSRRWEVNGLFPTIALMWCLRLAYFLGADPNSLACLYRKSKPS